MTPESRPNADHFKGAVDHARWELDLLWRVHATFLVPLIFLLGFSLQASVSSQTSPDARVLIVIALLLGLLMCFPWFVIGQRGQSSYDFRMAQARGAEPADGNLIAGDGKKFADGEPVKSITRPIKASAPTLLSLGFDLDMPHGSWSASWLLCTSRASSSSFDCRLSHCPLARRSPP